MSRHPTPYGDLNGVLAELTRRAEALLGDNLVGAYLQGSFALGDFNESSDVDFVMVVRDDPTDDEAAALQAMHVGLFDLASPWAHHLEGSYFPADILRRLTPTPRDAPGAPRAPDWVDPATRIPGPRVYPTWFIGHGEKTLARSEHDNTDIVRWILREKGVVLAGPDPKTLVDEVAADALRREGRLTLARLERHCLTHNGPIEWLWHQSFLVTIVCRILHAEVTGAVTSKAAASAWARAALEPRWSGLIERAQAAWRSPVRAGPANPAEVAATRDFLRYALAWRPPAGAAAGMRALLARREAVRRQGPPGGHGGRPGGLDGRGGVGHGRPPSPPTRPGGRGRRG